MRAGFPRGFTLVELLIVVAIIAILAAIAIPNFLESQTRAKVSRVKSDLRTLATAIEQYHVDWAALPLNDGVYNNPPAELSTPVAYLSNAYLPDPFTDKERHPIHGNLERVYTYTEIVDLKTSFERQQAGRLVPVEAIDHPAFNLNAFKKYGAWRLVSNGPDRSYPHPDFSPGIDPSDPNDTLKGSDILYDPTNGSISPGNILRTQKSTQPQNF